MKQAQSFELVPTPVLRTIYQLRYAAPIQALVCHHTIGSMHSQNHYWTMLGEEKALAVL